MTDREIEVAAKKAGARWNGSAWTIEDADLHPFVRALLAAERERCASICDGIGAGYTGAARRLDGQHATHAAGQRDGANECAAEIRRA